MHGVDVTISIADPGGARAAVNQTDRAYSRASLASERDVSRVIAALSEIRACPNCGTRIRFGDLDCPHCGLDLEDSQRDWAADLVDRISDHAEN